MKHRNTRICVAMSGGVDSSVSAYLLKNMGHDVFGVFVSGWEDFEGCSAINDFEDVVLVCDLLGIDYYSFDFKEEYRSLVFQYFLDTLKQGKTPNPDILCNSKIKFDILLKAAMNIGASHLATGHYCNILTQNGCNVLAKGTDDSKDQSYFLHAIDKSALSNVMFPIGSMLKKDVKNIAKECGLHNHNKKESMGICFVGKKPYNKFISQFLGECPGDTLDEHGNIIGNHNGAHFFTIGQRRGIGIGGHGHPWFVAKKNITENTITVVQGKNHPLLFSSTFYLKNINWLQSPTSQLTVKTRYRQQDVPCSIYKENDILTVNLTQKIRAITDGQYAVFYNGPMCIGGGEVITCLDTCI